MKKIKLSVLIPAYLEAENLRLILPRLRKTLSAITPDFEILVLDTCVPMDDSESICREHKALCIRRRPGNAYGDAVRSGLSAARGEWVLFMDADGSHPPEFISRLWEKREGGDVIIASRYIAGGNTDNPALLVLMSHLVNLMYSLVLGLKCRDVSNSFKLYRGKLLENIVLRCQNFDVVEELLYKIKKKMNKSRPGLNLVEVPFTFQKRLFGHTKRNLFLFIFSYAFTLLRLRFFS